MDIAIIGLGCRFPGARDPLGFWNLVRDGRVTFRAVPPSRWDHSAFYDAALRLPDKTYVERGAYLDDDDLVEFGALHFGIAPRRVQVTDPQHRLLLETVRCALQDAGYETRAWDRRRAGVFVGASVSEYKELLTARVRATQVFGGQFGRKALGSDSEELLQALTQDVVPMRAFSIAGNLLNMAAATVAQQYDLGGPAFSIDAACSSALVATQQAIVNLRGGQIDLAIAGGVYLNLLPDNLVGFARIGAISRSGECRPFDAKADGFIMGEGVGAVILKRREDAERDGDRIYALIRGAGCNNDGRSEGPMTPRQGGQLEALRLAYQDAGIPAHTVGYVEAHGTATTVGDMVEVAALREKFVEDGWDAAAGAGTALGSVKANIGHTMSAAGIAGLLKATLALHYRTLPPQPSIEEENPRLALAAQGSSEGPFYLPRTPLAWEPRDGAPLRAAVSSFGFGGTNAHLVLEEAPRPARGRQLRPAGAPVARAAPSWSRAELFVLGGPRSSVAARAARELLSALPSLEREGTTLAGIAFSLSQRNHGDARLAVVASSFAQLGERLAAAADALEARAAGHPADLATPPVSGPTQLGPGIAFAQGPFEPDARGIALLFPGQGAQRVGLLREAYEEIPAFRERLDQLDDALGSGLHAALGGTLRSFLYPDLPLRDGEVDPAALAAAEERLTETQVCQPAMAAVGIALHALLTRMGLVPAAVLGHSLGEFAAAAAAGILSGEECVRLVARRGLAMVALPLADRGAMASAATDRRTVAEVLASLPEEHREGGALPVVAANLNHPQQTVLSGSTAGVSLASRALLARGIQVTPLHVSHAFHSPLLAGVGQAMEELVQGLALQPAAVPVVSGITGALYPSDAASVREIWVRHATAPVDFVAALRTSAAPPPAGAAARLFLQVGAGGALVAFAKGALPESDRRAQLALASREEDGLAQLALALGTLWTAGTPLSFEPLFEGRDVQPALLPPTPIETQPYWVIEKAGKEAAPPIPVFTSQGGPSQASGSPDKGNEMDPLVALFREQIALLQTHAQVLQRQAEALASRGTPLPGDLPAALASLSGLPGLAAISATASVGSALRPASGTAQPAPLAEPRSPARPAAFPQPAPLAAARLVEPGGGAASPQAQRTSPIDEPALRAEVARQILGFVSRISAFPVAAVKTAQTLAGDLGFDSLMTVELDGDIQKAFPSAGGIPRTLLGVQTRVQDLIDHVVRALAAPAATAPSRNKSSLSAALDAVAEEGPELRFYAPQAVAVPRAAAAPGRSLLPPTLLLTRDALGIADALAARLAGQGRTVVVVELGTPDSGVTQQAPRYFSCCFDGADAAALFANAARAAGAPVGGVLHLAPLSAAGTLQGLLTGTEGPQLPDALSHLLWAHRLARAQAQAGEAANGGLFVVATRQGGKLGLDSAGDAQGLPVAAALAGWAKALSRERSEELVKRIDLDPALPADEAAASILAELSSGDAAAEVGLTAQGRFEADLAPAPRGEALALTAKDVVLVSGGAHGVGLKLAQALAKAGCSFILAGRSAPGAQSEAALSSLRKLSAKAAYVQWDVTAQAPAALGEARARLGPITAVLHAAGVSEDGPSASKEEASFLRVLGPKVTGLSQLLAATAADPLRLAVLVSSWSGRFGNAGQVDYSAANALLSAAARALPALRPGVRALALAFPPWEGTSMVERIPQLARAVLLEQGVPFIDDAAGARALQGALEDGAAGEILLAHARPTRRLSHRAQLTVLRSEHVYLEDHQLAGTPVLPLASALDLAASAAAAAAPGAGPTILLRDFKLLQPVRVTEGTVLTLSATGEARPHAEMRVTLSQAPLGAPRSFARPPAYVGFATVGADVTPALGSALPAPAQPAGMQVELPLALADFYANTTFHGPLMQGIESIESVSPSGIVGWVRVSKPSAFIKESAPAQWTVDPLALDGAFQLAGYWAWTQLARAGFPIGIDEYVQVAPLGDSPLRATLTLEQANGDLVRGTIVLQSKDGRVLAFARGVEGEFKHRDPRFLRARGPVPLRPARPAATQPGSTPSQLAIQPAATSQPTEATQATATQAAGTQPAATTQSGAGLAEAPLEVDEANYRIELFPEVEELEQRLGLAVAFGLKNPYFNVHERVTNDTSVIGGRTMINWSSY
ncbi:MAG TPA: SDR family NAD(P)-dependent oxidoreductase, partial [Myxococcales bacterium]|nr:SDR family NAD(P)-dependent oxidoreductase [Myxococcales bacterium]